MTTDEDIVSSKRGIRVKHKNSNPCSFLQWTIFLLVQKVTSASLQLFHIGSAFGIVITFLAQLRYRNGDAFLPSWRCCSGNACLPSDGIPVVTHSCHSCGAVIVTHFCLLGGAAMGTHSCPSGNAVVPHCYHSTCITLGVSVDQGMNFVISFNIVRSFPGCLRNKRFGFGVTQHRLMTIKKKPEKFFLNN